MNLRLVAQFDHSLQKSWVSSKHLVTKIGFTLLAILGFLPLLQAQVTVTGGTGAAAGSPYSTVSAAIAAINSGGAFTAPVTVNVVAGHTETLAAAIVLTETGTSANPLTIQKNGAGANPVLNGYVGINNGATATGFDAMFVLNGADYVTIDGINLNGTSATAATDAMEMGYALVKSSSTNGSQNNTLKNLTVSMNAQFSRFNIAVINCSATSLTAVDATAASGSNSFNTIKSCTLLGGLGVFMRSFNAPAPYTLADEGNVVGGNSPADGNIVKNFGGFSTSDGQGIFMNNQWGYLVKYNTVNNNDGTHVNHVGAALRGIFCNISGSGAGGEVSYNDISLKYGGTQTGTTISGTSTTHVVGIEMKTSNTAGTAGNTVVVKNNYIHNFRYSNATATLPCAGIILASAASNVDVLNNEITDFEFTATAAAIAFYGIANFTVVPGYLRIDNNNIHDITNLNNTSTSYVVYNSVATLNYSFSNNTITNISRAVANAGTFYGYFNTSSPASGTSLVRNNTISNFTNGTGLLAGINKNLAVGHVSKANLNTVQNLSSNSTSILYGIYNLTGAPGSSIDSNTVNNLSNPGTGGAYGIFQSGTTATFSIARNVVTNLSSGGNTYGIYGAGTLNNIFNNDIHGLSTSSTGTSQQSTGIYLTTSTQMNVYNNLIYDLSANTTTNLTGLNGVYVNLGTNVNIVHNTIYPTSTTAFVGGAGGGSTGVYMAAATNGVIDNNIIYLSAGSGATGNGFVTAIKRSSGSAGVTPTNLTMKGNILFAPYIYSEGSSSASAVNIFHTGAGTFGTADNDFNTPCGLFKSFMAGGAVGTFSEDNLSFTGTGYEPSGVSFAESGAIVSSPNPSFDFLGATRGTPADIGAIEFTGAGTDAAAPVIAYSSLPNQNCVGTVVIPATITDLTGVNATSGSAPRVYFKKSTEANAFIPSSPNNSTYNGWKYVQATGSGTNYSLTMNFSLLTSPLAAGETINYFVVAQDLLATPNVGINAGTFQSGVCPTSVNLPATAFPVSGFSSFTVLNPATITVSATPPTVCSGNTVTLNANVANSGVVTIGSGTITSSTTSPYNGSTTVGRRNQYIFTAAELTAAGMSAGPISSIAMDVTTTSGFQNIPDLVVKMGHTSTSISTTAYLADPTTTVVDYTGVGYLPAQGLNTHVFTTPFVWDGTSNVFIEMCHGVLAVTATIVVRYQTSTGNKVTYASNVAGCSYTGTGTVSTIRPFVTFNAFVSVASQYSFAWSNGINPIGTNSTSVTDNPTFPSGPMTYSIVATDLSGCTSSGNVVVTQNVTTPAGTANADNNTICIGSSVILSSTAVDGCPPYAYSWSDGSSVVSTLASFTATPTSSTTYTLTITDNASQTFSPAPVAVTVNNPQVLSTVPGTRCGTGTVNLSATGSGSDMNWYTAPTGGSPIGTGSSFTTPTISTTTDYYVAASTGGFSGNVGPLTPQSVGTVSASTIAIGTQYSIFEVLVPTTLISVNVFPTATGNGSISIANSSGTVLVTVPYTSTVSDGVTPVTVMLNFPMVPGTGYRMGQGTALNLNRNTTGATYPYTSGAINITGNSFDPVYFYFFYNWSFSSGCEGPRTAVTATVTAPPSLTISGTTSTICENSSTGSVNVTSNVSDFDTYVWTPSGTATGTTSATFNPVVSTTYTLTATNTTTGCANTAFHDVIVNPAPPLTVSATPNPVCEGENVVLFANSVPTVPYSMNSAGTATYIDIDPTGTSVGTVGDDTEHNITIPSFLFNGVSYTTARVGMNGLIVLGSSTGEVSLTNAALPSTTNTAGNVFLAPWWDDLDIQTAATIKTETVGNKHIIQFTDVAHNAFTTAPIEFQVQLDLTNGEIHFVYPDVIFGNATYDAGASATVGIQFSGTSALQYSFNTASLTNNQTITFTPLSNTLAWSGPSSFTSTVASNTLTGVTLANAGTYTVIATGNNTCTKTETVTLVVNQATSSTTTASDPVSYTWSANGTTYTTSGTYTHTLVNAAGCDSNLTLNLTIGVTNPTVNITAFIEGYYIPASSPAAMVSASYDNLVNAGSATPGNATDVSLVTVELWTDALGAAFTASGMLNSNGTLSVTFPVGAAGGTYWLALTSPNTLRTFSANSVTLGATTAYDFSTSLASAATDGSSAPLATLTAGLFGLRSGDINQDEFIDGTDYSVFEGDVVNSANGAFSLASDLNGDSFVDGTDYPILDLNSSLGLYAQYPSFL